MLMVREGKMILSSKISKIQDIDFSVKYARENVTITHKKYEELS